MFDFSARYGIEFDNNGNKQIYIAKASAPYDGESFGVVFDSSDREDEIFSSTELPTDNSADNEFMWTLTHCTTMNNTDIVEYIGENGLWFYHTTINLAAGEKFSLKNFTTNELIGADYLVDITGDIAAVTREGDLVSVTNSGSFYIIYLPAFNSFTIDCDTSSSSSEINMYLDGEFISLTKEGEVVTYTNLEATTSTNIAFVNGTFTVYYPIAIDSQTDSAIAHVVESMVDANLQREHILPSEKAAAYKMKMDAMKRRAGRPSKDNPRPVVGDLETADIVGKELDDSGRQVQRYIRLTELVPELLEMVDRESIAFRPAVELSYLSEDEQRNLVETIDSEEATPSLSQAIRMKKLSQEGKLDMDKIFSIMTEEKPNQAETVKFKSDELSRFFPERTPPELIRQTIFKLLDAWQKSKTPERPVIRRSRDDAR